MSLGVLRIRFVDALERRLSDLAALVDANAPDALMRAFHSLAGIGGTYGYDGITDESRVGENLCWTAIDEQRTLTEDEREQLRNAIASIRRCAHPIDAESNASFPVEAVCSEGKRKTPTLEQEEVPW